MADLITTAEFRTFQNVSGAAATGQTTLIEENIDVATAAIEDFCQVEFTSAADTERTFRYDGRGVLSLAPYVVRSIDSVEVDSDTDNPTTLDSDSYRMAPIPARHGVFNTLHLYGLGVSRSLTDPAPDYRHVSVTGDWGFAAVPAAVKRACCITVNYMLKVGSQHQGNELDVADIGWGGSGVLIPGMAKRLLAPYRRFSTGA